MNAGSGMAVGWPGCSPGSSLETTAVTVKAPSTGAWKRSSQVVSPSALATAV